MKEKEILDFLYQDAPQRFSPQMLYASLITRFTGRYTINAGNCWLWNGFKYKNGYGRFSVGRKHFYAHRISFLISKGKIPSNLQICHICDIRECVNPEHLFLGTPKDNTQDMIRKGRRNPNYKFSFEDIIKIHKDYESGLTQNQIALKYQTAQGLISRTLRCKPEYLRGKA